MQQRELCGHDAELLQAARSPADQPAEEPRLQRQATEQRLQIRKGKPNSADQPGSVQDRQLGEVLEEVRSGEAAPDQKPRGSDRSPARAEHHGAESSVHRQYGDEEASKSSPALRLL